jgi:hypothetical protein
MVLDPDRFQIRSKKVSSWKQESFLGIHGQLITADVLYTNALFSSNVEFRIIHEFVEKSLDCTICFLRNCRMWNRLILFRTSQHEQYTFRSQYSLFRSICYLCCLMFSMVCIQLVGKKCISYPCKV